MNLASGTLILRHWGKVKPRLRLMDSSWHFHLYLGKGKKKVKDLRFRFGLVTRIMIPKRKETKRQTRKRWDLMRLTGPVLRGLQRRKEKDFRSR